MGIGTDALIESTMRFADLYSQPEFYQNLNQLTSHSGNAAKEIALMSREFRTLARELRREVRTLSPTAITVNNAASKAGITADRASVTFEQINSLLAASRGKLVASLDSIEQTSVALRLSLRQLGPTIDRFQQSQVLTDLERLSANAAATSENLKDVSQNLNNPATLASLQQTLDAARSTFQNAQKITADLDEITGDPEMRKQFKEVIKGFGNLLSSSQQLQRNAAYAQQLAPTAAQQLTQQRTAQPTPAPVAPLSPPGLAKPVALGQSQRILPPVLSSEPPVKALGTVVK
jgi:phospholipid/cholesterol/gamma-HCH transport system substrate-binding protein